MQNVNHRRLPLIGIVTVLFNSENVLPGFFESLSKQQGILYKLYVIDNSPKDTGTVMSRDLAAGYGIDTTLKYNNANLGVAEGNNQGIRMARNDGCDVILLANNDIEFGPTTISHLAHNLEGKQCGAVVPKIMYYDKKNLVWYAGGTIKRLAGIVRHDGMGSEDHGQFDMERYVDYAPTCFFMCASTLFDVVGMMDDKYFVYYDDTDFVLRMQSCNKKIFFVPNVLVFHKVSSSTGGMKSPVSIYYGNRNRLYFIRKNFHGATKAIAVAYTLSTRIVRTLAMRPSLARTMWRGVRDGILLPVA